MKKIIIIDGIDNTGKTWLVNALHDRTEDSCKIAFPTPKLIESQEFKRVTEEPTSDNKDEWLECLYEEEFNAILPNLQFDYIFVDRMWVSTLVYQGDSLAGRFQYEKKIMNMYQRLFSSLGIYPNQIETHVLLYPLTDKDPSETNPIKIHYDSKQAELYCKLMCILPFISRLVYSFEYPFATNGILCHDEWNPLGKNFFIGKQNKSNIVSLIQEGRLNSILLRLNEIELSNCKGP